MTRAPFLLCLMLAACSAQPKVERGDQEVGYERLDACIAYHDPEGAWREGTWRFLLEEQEGEEGERAVEVVLDNQRGVFLYGTLEEAGAVELELAGETFVAHHDGREVTDPARREQLGLTERRARLLREYYGFLLGLPMVLARDASRVVAAPRPVPFAGRETAAIAVQFTIPGGREDAWTFYLDPETSRLLGWRSYHVEGGVDGRFVVLNGEVEEGGLRVPLRWRWYENHGGAEVGSHRLTGFSRVR